MDYTTGNKCTKNCCKRTILVQLIVEDVVTGFFLRDSVDNDVYSRGHYYYYHY